MEIIEYLFGSFWRWLGAVIILLCVFGTPFVVIEHNHYDKDGKDEDGR